MQILILKFFGYIKLSIQNSVVSIQKYFEPTPNTSDFTLRSSCNHNLEPLSTRKKSGFHPLFAFTEVRRNKLPLCYKFLKYMFNIFGIAMQHRIFRRWTNLETYFLSESQIQLWLDQLIEKIITVSQLEETQSEYFQEFEKGRKLVEEITGLLTNISSLPPSSVFEPIIHLIEQRLQCQKITDLSGFNRVMEAIVSNGIAFVSGESDIGLQTIPALAATANLNSNNLQLTSTLSSSNINDNNSDPDPLKPVSGFQFDKIPAMVNNDEEIDIIKEQFNTSEKEPQCESQLNSQKELPLIRNENNLSLIPQEAARLALIIKQIFPNSQVRWNFCLGEYNFLVQVENLLIYLEALNEGEIIRKEMEKDGWNILICQKEDLSFPRRFEREIKRILKKSKPNTTHACINVLKN